MTLTQSSKCFHHSVTVQCTRDGQFVVVVARDATEPKLDVDSVSLLNSEVSSCSVIDYTASFAVFQFPVTECGTVVKEVGVSVMQVQQGIFVPFHSCTLLYAPQEDGYIVYENHMTSSYDVGVGPKGSITRDSHFE